MPFSRFPVLSSGFLSVAHGVHVFLFAQIRTLAQIQKQSKNAIKQHKNILKQFRNIMKYKNMLKKKAQLSKI